MVNRGGDENGLSTGFDCVPKQLGMEIQAVTPHRHTELDRRTSFASDDEDIRSCGLRHTSGLSLYKNPPFPSPSQKDFILALYSETHLFLPPFSLHLEIHFFLPFHTMAMPDENLALTNKASPDMKASRRDIADVQPAGESVSHLVQIFTQSSEDEEKKASSKNKTLQIRNRLTRVSEDYRDPTSNSVCSITEIADHTKVIGTYEEGKEITGDPTQQTQFPAQKQSTDSFQVGELLANTEIRPEQATFTSNGKKQGESLRYMPCVIH